MLCISYKNIKNAKENLILHGTENFLKQISASVLIILYFYGSKHFLHINTVSFHDTFQLMNQEMKRTIQFNLHQFQFNRNCISKLSFSPLPLSSSFPQISHRNISFHLAQKNFILNKIKATNLDRPLHSEQRFRWMPNMHFPTFASLTF